MDGTHVHVKKFTPLLGTKSLVYHIVGKDILVFISNYKTKFTMLQCTWLARCNCTQPTIEQLPNIPTPDSPGLKAFLLVISQP